MKSLTAGALALAMMSSANAAELDYSYLEIGGSYVWVSDFDNGDGVFGIDGSVLVTENLYISGGIGGDGDATSIVIGPGLRLGVSERTDFVAEIGVANIDTDFGSDTGGAATIGLRSMVSDSVEVNGGIGAINVFDDTDVSANLGVVVHISDAAALTSGVSVGSDSVRSLSVGVRFGL